MTKRQVQICVIHPLVHPRTALSAWVFQLTLVDVNAPESDNALYNTEMLSLDGLALTAGTTYRQTQGSVPPVDFSVNFDEPLGSGM